MGAGQHSLSAQAHLSSRRGRWVAPLVLAVLAAVPVAGMGQTGYSVAEPASAALATEGAAGATGAAGAPRRAWSIVPRLTLQETFTDNVAPGTPVKTSDQITEISPGVRIAGQTARLKASLDYSLRGLIYAQGSRGDQTQNALNAAANLEVVDRLLFVDFSGIVTRQNISAFGVQSPADYSVNNNATETSNFRVSPYLKGRAGSLAEYELRYSRSVAHSKSSAVADTDIDDWRGVLKGATGIARLGWSVEAGRQDYDFNQGRKSQSQNWRGLLSYAFGPQWKVSVSGGREENDFVSLSRQAWNTNGYGVDWRPGERTQFSVFREKRFFGFGHTLTLSHRLPLSAVKFVDSRDVSALPTQLTTVGLGNIYDLLFTQMASAIPDEAARADYILNLLRANGISPNATVTGGFLSSQLSVQRRQELSYALRGARNTLTLVANRTRNDRLGAALGAGDDFSISSSIVQRGAIVGWSHQLSGLSSLTVNGGRSRSTGQSSTSQDMTQKMLSAGLSTRLGPKANAGVTARRTLSDNATASYSENAVIGTVSIQF